MSADHRFPTILCVVTLFICGTSLAVDHERNMKIKLLRHISDLTRKHRGSHYSRPLKRPVKSLDDTVKVHFGVSITHIEQVKGSSQKLRLQATVYAYWEDINLKWERSEYGNLHGYRMPTNRWFWQPDLQVLNSNAAPTRWHGWSETIDWLEHKPYVQFQGGVSHYGDVSTEIVCHYDFTMYPFDTQKCALLIGSMAYNAKQLDYNLPWVDSDLALPMKMDVKYKQHASVDRQLITNDKIPPSIQSFLVKIDQFKFTRIEPLSFDPNSFFAEEQNLTTAPELTGSEQQQTVSTSTTGHTKEETSSDVFVLIIRRVCFLFVSFFYLIFVGGYVAEYIIA